MKTEIIRYGRIELEARSGTHDIEMAREIFEDRYYTCDGWDIPAGAPVLDIGGCIGAFAVFAVAHGARLVYSFEPIPESYALLIRNAAPWPAIMPVQGAVAVGGGYVTMSGFGPMEDGTINTGLPAISDTGLKVEAHSIHDVIKWQAGWYLKLDIEGYEYELLESLSAEEMARIDVISMEFHHDDEATAYERGQRLAAYLHDFGFDTETDWSWGCQGRLRARR